MTNYDTYNKTLEREFVNPRRAVIDFSLLAIIGYLFLAFLKFGDTMYLIVLPLPFYAVFILSLLKNKIASSAAIGGFIGLTLTSVFNGSIWVSISEWGQFFREGSSLLFFDLSHVPLLLISTGMAINACKEIGGLEIFRQEATIHAVSVFAVLAYYLILGII